MTVKGRVTKGAKAAIEAAGGKSRNNLEERGTDENGQIFVVLRAASELKSRLLFVIGACHYSEQALFSIPGVDAAVLADLFDQQGTIVDMFNMFSGGALGVRASILALGIMPYISASIVVQLLTVVHPALAELKKETGRRKISQYTRYGTLVRNTPSYWYCNRFTKHGPKSGRYRPNHVYSITVSLVTGTMFLMWLGEQITERGIGNGISILIFAGIVAGLPSAIGQTIDQARGDLHVLLLLLMGYCLCRYLLRCFHGAWSTSNRC